MKGNLTTFEKHLGSKIRKIWKFIGCVSNKDRRIKDNSQNLIQTSEWVTCHQLKWRVPKRMKVSGEDDAGLSLGNLRFRLIVPGQDNTTLGLR